MGTFGQAEPGLSSTSCSLDSAYTTRPSPERTIAPAHMPHGWQLVYIVVRAAASGLSSAAAQRASLSSGCAVMSLSRDGVVRHDEDAPVVVSKKRSVRRVVGCHGVGRDRDGPSKELVILGRDHRRSFQCLATLMQLSSYAPPSSSPITLAPRGVGSGPPMTSAPGGVGSGPPITSSPCGVDSGPPITSAPSGVDSRPPITSAPAGVGSGPPITSSRVWALSSDSMITPLPATRALLSAIILATHHPP